MAKAPTPDDGTKPIPNPPTTTQSTSSTSAAAAPQPPLDPTKLNHTPAPLPLTSDPEPASLATRAESSNDVDTPYLDGGLVEPASHPTVAETGLLHKSPSRDGPGPVSGQLKRVEGGERRSGDGIIKLGSFGGEGLMAKPAMGSPTMQVPEEAIAD